MGDRIRVLAIEDDIGDSEILRRYLSDGRHVALDFAERLSVGLEKLARDPFDLVLLDLGLPDSQGIQTISEFLIRAPDVPVLVLTGQEDEAVGTEAVRLGAQDFLSKSQINPELLMKSIRYAIERHHAVNAVENERQQLLSVFDSIDELIYVSDPNTYEVLFMNKHGRNLFKCNPVGGKCYTEIQARNTPCDFCTNEIILSNKGEPYEWELHNEIFNRDYHVTDRIIRWPDGRDVRLEVAIDVTQTKTIEKKFREQTRFLTALMESIPVPVFYTDVDHTYMGCNQAFAMFLGRDREAIVGKTVFELAPEKFAEQYRHQGDKLFQKSGVQVYESSIEAVDGQLRNVVLHKATFNDSSGQLAGLIGVIMDITERKRMERRLIKAQRLESIATLASGIAHDFNNLLTIISGYCELALADKTRGAPGYDELSVVLGAAGRGADLVKQILTFSREVESHLKPFRINSQVKHAQKLLSKTIPKMIKIQTDLADDLRVVMADPTQIEQVLLNLAVNSRDAMPNGGTITFTTENVSLGAAQCRLLGDLKPGEYVALTISDTGHGMEQHVLDRIFEPFFSTKNPGEGTGLGLATAFGIVKKHDGHMTCSSRPGSGTTFRIYLPAVEPGELDSEELGGADLEVPGSETILLVEDEPLISDLGKQVLTQNGYRVVTAANGKEALEKFQQYRGDIGLVMLDMIMPIMGGRECLSELLKIDPGVKVIIASGYASGGRPKDVKKTGARGFVEKPYNVKQVLETIRSVLDEN